MSWRRLNSVSATWPPWPMRRTAARSRRLHGPGSHGVRARTAHERWQPSLCWASFCWSEGCWRLPIAESLQQRVSLAREPSSALDWRPGGGATQIPIEFWEQPVLTQVRTLLARGKRMTWPKRPSCLLRAGQRRRRAYATRRLIEVGALEALVYASAGQGGSGASRIAGGSGTCRFGLRVAAGGGLWTGGD